MRWSQLFIPTLREDPADATVTSHRLLLRAGYIRQLATGIYSYLYLGQRSALKIMQILREEMDRIGGQEFYLPALHPAELWQETGRWQQFGQTMFRLKDRGGRDLCLGVTHEEVMTDIARSHMRSYRQLPQIWYQIQVKFRDEPRPKSGLMRLRQFIMKDSYSFDLDEAGLDTSYQKHHGAYCRIFDRSGLNYQVVEAHSGPMGGAQSNEFMVISPAGEDFVVTCGGCGYAANLEKAGAGVRPVKDLEGDRAPEPFPTPNVRTIDELVAFTGLKPHALLKGLAYVIPAESPKEKSQMVLALLRGDHQLNEAKLSDALGGAPFRPAEPQEVRATFGAVPGFIGPVGVNNVRILIDTALAGRKNLVTGANRDDHHLRHVTPGEDFSGPYVDLRTVVDRDPCAQCGKPLAVESAIEVGHIFKLGRRYAASMGLRVLDEKDRELIPIMGSYGIGVERILTAAVEQHHDADGMVLPRALAPFDVILTPVNLGEEPIRAAAEQLYAELCAAGLEVLYDERDERPGVKFKDADLIGIPYRITLGAQKVARGLAELSERSTRQRTDVRISEMVLAVRNRCQS
ncbi:MAG: proline--tRNA ligase [Terriglobia bacterium]